ncbi:TonB-dependent receptor [Undibacterium sp. 5I1]|uniref:TonB-dependent receptor n=1 Tax=unclassified Undibacterium TaxID=2630295 RepID=UPI002AB518F5|nr:MULTISPECIES: TonB-dependent receptor [unclassified Undibacterium]MDY7540398.1 TonB-dependent receptor [Undibacterium sp. 5I1]MEB0230030.1 TonB-dependent receptor [Undibacterium sp. 10I3]MEB0258050.1 TonB-dependent receptor [Undibacterium sp. 5I1]
MKRNVSGPDMAKPYRPLVLKVSVAALASAGMLTCASVWAQETKAVAAAADEGVVVVVTGVRKSAESALQIKRNSDQVIDTIVADDIGKFPDTNVAETLARVSGIQVRRDAGEANSVLIRGLPGIATLLNGREMYTTNGRYVNLADIPSTMLQRVDVYKSQSADLVEGGIAGVVDVRTNRPFDFKGYTFSANGHLENSDKSKSNDPNVGMMVSNRWKTAYGEFGALFGLSYVENKYQEERAFNTNPTSQGSNLTGPFVMGIEAIPGNRRRLAENVAVQWRPNADVELYAEGISTRYKNTFETDFFVGLPWLGNSVTTTTIPGTNQVQTISSHNTFTIDSTQANKADTLTQQFAVGGRWNASPGLKFTSEISTTSSKYTWANPILDTNTTVPNVNVNTSLNGTPNFQYTGIDMKDAKNFSLFQLFDRYGRDKGGSTDWRADGFYTPEADGLFKEFSAGVRVSSRTAESIKSFEGGVGAPPGINAASINGLSCVSPALGGNYGLAQWYTPCATFLINNTAAIRNAVTGSSSAKALDPGSMFQDSEKSYAFYGKTNVGFDLGSVPVSGVIGVRIVKTDEELQGNNLLTDGSYVATQKSSSSTDVLPSMSFKFNLRPDLIARLAAGKTITRPDFAQLNPGAAYVTAGVTVNPTATGGNPDLKPVTGRNFDAALEWYFAPAGSLSAAVFQHYFDGYILNKTQAETFAGTVYQVTRPYNTDSGQLQGLEVAYQQFYDKLPGWLGGFGLQANVTYMEGKTTKSVDPTLVDKPFTGLSKFSYNIAALYEKNGWSGRLAYNWRSKFVDTYNASNSGLDLTVAPISSLDGSLSYKITPNLSITLDGSNLLDFKYSDYFSNPNVYPRDTRRYDRRIGIGLNWKG